jgi:two-component system, NarL family, sensor histidine kinase UhpB
MVVQVESYKSEHAGQPRIVSQMDAMQESARDVLSNLRQLVYELRGEQGVGGCFVDALASHLARYERHTGIDTELTVLGGWPAKLLAPAASNLRSIILEALANASRHSGARLVSVVLEHRGGDELTVTVTDDGRGIEGPCHADGLGMTGMRERAALLGGQLSIEGGNGRGTTVRASFPRARLSSSEGRTN